MKTDISQEIEIPEKTEVSINKGIVTVKGPKGETSKDIITKRVNVEVKDKKIVLSSKKATQREKRIMLTIKSHISNMVSGVNDPYIYNLKICSSHFPMTASFNNNVFEIKNFYGESKPRKVKINEKVNVKLEGEIITVECVDKELAGQAAASMEQLCRITNKDRRIFQDGVYITSKPKRIQNE